KTHPACRAASITSGTRTSSTRSGTPRWRPTGSKTFGVDRCRRRQRSRVDQFAINQLGIRRRIALRKLLLNELDRSLDLLGGHRFDAAGMLDLHIARHQKRADLQVCRGLLLPHLCNGFRTVTPEVSSEREQEILVERSTRSLQ